MKAAVLGAGSWGTALAMVLTANGDDVALWSRSEAHVAEMEATRKNEKYLPQATLPRNIRVTSSLREAVSDAALVLFVVPSQAMRDVAGEAAAVIRDDQLVIHAAKGFEQGTFKRMSEVLAEQLQTHDSAQIVVLSGPSHAEEVAEQSPTTVVVSAKEIAYAEQAQDYLINPFFRVYTNPDVVGTEIGGALKNIIALSAGMSDGLGYGDNAKAALLTRGLAEIVRLGARMGADPRTFAGLAGFGDLVVTCTSKHSRNWQAGYLLGQGKPLGDVLRQMGMVVEGVKTTQTAHALAKQYQVEMPITAELYNVLFADKNPRLAVEHLMGRVKRHETEDVLREL